MANPGDGKYYHGILWPFTWEEYIEKLRTDWADNIFVLAGGADPGGNLREVSPLELDIYDPPMTCPPMIALTTTFLLRYDIAPLGQPPDSQGIGAEYIQWPDPAYPNGYPNDDEAFNEKEYALWDITYLIGDICNHQQFKMRVRVTDHLDNWVRSGVMDMSIGVEGIDSGGKIEKLSFYAVNNNGVPQFLYNYCDNDCNNPASCNPPNNTASSIEMRDENGNCVLHLVAKCSVLKQEKFPNSIPAAITSNEPYVPNNCLGLIIKPMWPVNPATAAVFDNLFGSPGTSLCYYNYYVCSVGVTDNAGDGSKLYVSHSDEAYPGYPFSNGCEDYTIIYDPSDEPIDFVRYAQNYHYGHKRGQSYECHSYDNSYFSEDRCIQVGGMHGIFASVDDKTTARPVQSGADLIIVASHGCWDRDANDEWQPLGMPGLFSGRLGGCLCPPWQQPFRDIENFSPVGAVSRDNVFDNDFENNNGDNLDFDGDFWQAQPSHDYVTWVLFLGCDILTPSNYFGYSPLEKWMEKIGKADVICGYTWLGTSSSQGGITDYIGGLFSEIMQYNETHNEELYIGGPPPDIYLYRPVRAWMEANCLALNEYNWSNSNEDWADKHTCTTAIALDFNHDIWKITGSDREGKYHITH